jgi:hypothetical protein
MFKALDGIKGLNGSRFRVNSGFKALDGVKGLHGLRF